MFIHSALFPSPLFIHTPLLQKLLPPPILLFLIGPFPPLSIFPRRGTVLQIKSPFFQFCVPGTLLWLYIPFFRWVARFLRFDFSQFLFCSFETLQCPPRRITYPPVRSACAKVSLPFFFLGTTIFVSTAFSLASLRHLRCMPISTALPHL